MNVQTCVLCGIAAADVKVGLIAWREPVGRDRYTAAPRCKNAHDCRMRVHAAGEEWEVREPDIRTVRDILAAMTR